MPSLCLVINEVQILSSTTEMLSGGWTKFYILQFFVFC